MATSTLEPETDGRLTVRLTQAAPIPLDVTLVCPRGEMLALVGPSGSGKTTVLRAIAGLYRPAAGRIVSGSEVWLDTAAGRLVPPQARRAGLVFQDYALFPHLTAADNVAVALGHVRPAERKVRAEALLASVNLAGLETRRPHQLSGGQRQRVALARALAREPRVLLLDEPFSAVDQMTRERLKRELALLKATVEIPILLVTHDLSEALALSDRIAVLHRGRTLQVGRPEDVRLRPVSPTVARLMGHTNIFKGRLTAPATEGRPGRLAWGGLDLEVADTGGLGAGQTVIWMIAADHLVLHRRGRPSLGEHENPVTGLVTELIGLGEQTAVTLAIAGDRERTLNLKVSTHAARRNELAVGVAATVSLLAAGIHLMAGE